MKTKTMLLVLATLATMQIAACDDGGGTGDTCDQAEAVVRAAKDEFCAGQTEVCCLCACWDQTDGHHDLEAYLADQSCVCIDPPTDTDSEAGAGCEGVQLENAQACLDDEEACVQPILQAMQIVCQGSPLG